MTKNKSALDIVIWIMISGWLIVDLFTGFFLNQGVSLPISQLYKILLLVLVSIQLIKNRRGLIVALWCLYVAVINLSVSFSRESIGGTLILLSKFILTYLFYIYFKDFAKNNQYWILNQSRRILVTSFILVALNILIGLIGIGYYTYPTEKIGYKGFFYAGNELGGVLAVLVPFFLYYVYVNYKRMYFVYASFFCIILSVLLGTKAFILVSLLSPLLIHWILSDRRTRLRIILTLCTFILIFVPMIISYLDSSNLDIITRLKFFYDKGGLTTILFSGRDEFWAQESMEFYRGGFLTQFFGLGGNRTVEMDHYDVLLNYGYLGVLIIYSSIAILFTISVLNRDKNSFSKVVILINTLLLGMSFIAGHVIFSSMAGMYIALVNVIGGIPSKNIIYEKKDSHHLKPLPV